MAVDVITIEVLVRIGVCVTNSAVVEVAEGEGDNVANPAGVFVVVLVVVGVGVNVKDGVKEPVAVDVSLVNKVPVIVGVPLGVPVCVSVAVPVISCSGSARINLSDGPGLTAIAVNWSDRNA